MSFFLAADACLSWSLPSITEQQVSRHRLPMQYWLKNHWPDQAFFKHSPHTNSISNSAILRNNYISLLSDLCTCVHGKKKWRRKGSHSSVSGSNHRIASCDFEHGNKNECRKAKKSGYTAVEVTHAMSSIVLLQRTVSLWHFKTQKCLSITKCIQYVVTMFTILLIGSSYESITAHDLT